METEYNGASIYEFAIDYASEKLKEMINETCYYPELIEMSMLDDNMDGGIFMYNAHNVEFICKNFNLLGEFYEEFKAQGIIEDLNIFDKPSTLIFLAVEQAIVNLLDGVDDILQQMDLLEEVDLDVEVSEKFVDTLIEVMEANYEEKYQYE